MGYAFLSKKNSKEGEVSGPGIFFIYKYRSRIRKKGMSRVTEFSAVNLIASAGVDPEKWNTQPSNETIAETVNAMGERGIRVIPAGNGVEALEILITQIPSGAEIMNGSSTTLIEIGYRSMSSQEDQGGRICMMSLPQRTMIRKGLNSGGNQSPRNILCPVRMPSHRRER